MNSRRGPAELSYIRLQELIQEVLEMNQFLDSGFAQPLGGDGDYDCNDDGDDEGTTDPG